MFQALIVLFVISNKNKFAANSYIHGIDTKNEINFHQPLSVLTSYQKGPYYFGIKVFTCLPEHIKNLSHNMV
jgi:hypothetical protein